MIEQIAEWAWLIGLVGTYVGILLRLLEFLKTVKDLDDTMKNLPHLLKLLTKFLVYSLSLAVPNVIIIWYFFYQAGLSPDRLSEVEFFRAVVMNPTVFVSLYAYIWGIWIYPRLQHLLGESKSPQETKRISRASSESSKRGGKK